MPLCCAENLPEGIAYGAGPRDYKLRYYLFSEFLPRVARVGRIVLHLSKCVNMDIVFLVSPPVRLEFCSNELGEEQKRSR